MIVSLIGCDSEEKQETVVDSYVKDDGTVVVNGVEIQDAFVTLQIDGVNIDDAKVLDIDIDEIEVECVNVDEIQVLEAEVVSLNDEFVYLAYQNFISYYEEDIDWETFVKDVAIGATCVIVCVTLSTVGGPVGTFFGAVICSEFTAATVAVGAAIDAAVSGYMAYQEGGDASYIIGHMLNGVADGFKWAAIMAPVSGAASGIKALKAVNQMKKLPGFSEVSDKAINQLLKDFSKIVKKSAKTPANVTDDVVRKLYREVSKELSGDITEDVFLVAFRNSDDIVKIVHELNPFNTARELTSTMRNSFFEKANIEEDVAKDWIKKIQNKSVTRLDDIPDENVRKCISDNMYEFVQLFGNSASIDLVDDCMKKSLQNCLGGDGEKAYAVVKNIITENNSYCKLVAEIGEDSAEKILKDKDTLILLQTRYGTKNVNQLIDIQRMYLNLVQNRKIDINDTTKIVDGLLDGNITSIDDITKINSSAGENAYKSAEALSVSIKNLGIEAKSSKFLNDVSEARLEFLVDPNVFTGNSVDDIVEKSFSKQQIIESIGNEAYQELVEKSDRVIQALSLSGNVNNSLIEDLFTDALTQEGLSEEIITKIKAGCRISEWGLSDEIVRHIGNNVADYYKATNVELYRSFNLEYSEVRCGLAKIWNEANDVTPNNAKYYLGTVMTPKNLFVKEKYGDVYMNTAGYPILDDFAIARIEISDLTGIDGEDIERANKLHHGTTSNIPGYTWHHVEDGKTLLLVPSDLHEAYRHSGGAALIRDGAFDIPKFETDELLVAWDMVKKIDGNGGNALDGYVGGRTFQNVEGLLPDGITYKEYDINPKMDNQGRDALRLVLGDDGSAYYTNDHYDSFVKLR